MQQKFGYELRQLAQLEHHVQNDDKHGGGGRGVGCVVLQIPKKGVFITFLKCKNVCLKGVTTVSVSDPMIVQDPDLDQTFFKSESRSGSAKNPDPIRKKTRSMKKKRPKTSVEVEKIVIYHI